MPIIAAIPQNERRQMQEIVQKTRDKDYARRLTAMLMLREGSPVSRVAKTLCAAHSFVGRWINWFTEYGSDELKSLPVGCPRYYEHFATSADAFTAAFWLATNTVEC